MIKEKGCLTKTKTDFPTDTGDGGGPVFLTKVVTSPRRLVRSFLRYKIRPTVTRTFGWNEENPVGESYVWLTMSLPYGCSNGPGIMIEKSVEDAMSLFNYCLFLYI